MSLTPKNNKSQQENHKFKATFSNGGFWEYYKDLERQFVEYLNYVPYVDGNETTYSFRLVNVILSIGAHIDSAFKEMTQYPKFSRKYPNLLKKDGTPKKLNIRDYNSFITEYQLQTVSLDFKRILKRETITPFHQYKLENDKLITPNWWQTYNSIKHDFSGNFHKADLKTARDALAGAFLLNVVHEPALFRLNEYKLLMHCKTFVPITKQDLQIYLNNSIPECVIETDVFFYDYHNGPRYIK